MNTNSSALHIRRWRNDFWVPRDCDASERIHADLDDIAGRLSDELIAGLAPWWSDQRGQVVLIERLSFDCELDLSREPALLAARWAYHFAKALIDAVESGTDGVLRFASPAAYRAQFITDLANGSSGDAWYYRSFTGLAALPPAGAIRTVLLEDRQLGRETLVALPPGIWERLGAVLTRREALRILDELSADGNSEEVDFAVLAALFKEYVPRLPAVPWFVTALHFFSAALRAGLNANSDLIRWIKLAARLPALAARSDAMALAEALRQGNIGALVAVDIERDAESWVALSSRPAWRSTLTEILQAEIVRTSGGLPRSTNDRVHTAFGGLVLLLAELDSLLNEALSSALPSIEPVSARNLVAWLVLAQCTGQTRAAQFLGEAFWRKVFGIPPEIDRTRLNRWLSDADATPAAVCLAECTATWIRGTCLPVPLKIDRQRWRVSVDQATGIWCEINNLFSEFHDVSCGQVPTMLDRLTGSEMDAMQSPDSVSSIPWSARLAIARRARDDWRYLTMDWGLPEPWQRLFTQMAQIVLRRFAYRIPGFTGASLPYVFSNFLAGSGTFETESGCLQLSRPPLHILLNITGIGRGTVRWSGPPEQSFILDYAP